MVVPHGDTVVSGDSRDVNGTVSPTVGQKSGAL